MLTLYTVTDDRSRARALQLMADFDLSESKTTLGSVSWIFFQQHRGSLCARARDGKPLEDRLRHLVLGFSTGLNVMQRLEARHHLVNLALAYIKIYLYTCVCVYVVSNVLGCSKCGGLPS